MKKKILILAFVVIASLFGLQIVTPNEKRVATSRWDHPALPSTEFVSVDIVTDYVKLGTEVVTFVAGLANVVFLLRRKDKKEPT